MTDTALVPMSPEVEQAGLARYQPANLKQLVWFAGEVAKSGMYLKTDANGNQVPMTTAETFMVMSEGVEMGVSPITAMRNIYLMEDKKGRKTTIPRADLIAARIQADPRTERWDVDDETPGRVTVTAKRKFRETVHITLTLDDIPTRDKERWARGYLDTQEMLTNRTIRRIARRHFKDMVLGMGVDQDIDDRRVIDVAKVEQVTNHQGAYDRPHRINLDNDENLCRGRVWLQSTRQGGAYLRCDACTATWSPPQEVRDAVRGTPEHLTLAASSEPVLEPGERIEESEPADASDSAVQSESERDTIGEQDVAGEPERPMPEPADPEDSAKQRHQDVRNAIYSHWSLPRPPEVKIEMRGLLSEFGWDGGATLGDWMLGQNIDTLDKIADALAAFR